MAQKAASRKKPNLIEPATVTRLLVVSFFIALSLGLIEGADIKLLATPFLPEHLAIWSMRALMLGLSVMVLVGFYRRPAALILALMIFWPSYMTLFAGGDVSAFWRDLALIGGLIMSAAETAKAPDNMAEAPENDMHSVSAPFVHKPAPPPQEAIDEAYREDLNLARTA
jgi:hypothetical protein